LEVVIDSGGSFINDIALDLTSGKIYWQVFDKIRRANLDGSNVEEVVDDFFAAGLALDPDAGHIYFTILGGFPSTILRANVDGSGHPVLIVPENNNGARGIVLDVPSGMMYWADHLHTAIRRADLNGSGIEPVVTAFLPAGVDLDLAAGKLYWSDIAGGCQIHRANLDGSEPEDLASCSGVHSVVFDGTEGKIYWRNSTSIERADADGSNREVVVTGLTTPNGTTPGGLEVDPDPSGPVPAVSGVGLAALVALLLVGIALLHRSSRRVRL
jgi:hypothetical protein